MQLYCVLYRGILLASRREDDGGVNLYHCAGCGFFVKVGIDNGRGQVVVQRIFSDSGGSGELCASSGAAEMIGAKKKGRPSRDVAAFALG